jgi:hypothetical protein
VATEIEAARDRLYGKLLQERRKLQIYDNYYEGEQPLRFMSPLLKKELGDRITEIVVEWPRLAVEAYDNRLDIEGFRFAGSDSSDDELWRVWQANEGDFISQQGHQEHLALSRAYTIVGNNPEDPETPVITVESPFDAIHEDDPASHDTRYGIKTWALEDRTRFINVYYPGGRVTFRRVRGAWVEDSSDEDDFKLVRLTPLINQPRMLGRHRPGRFDQRLGRSIFHPIIPLADAVNKLVTDMMVSAEFHAMPRRWAVGLDEKDFVDEETGEALGTWEMIAGRIWASANKDVKMGQFSEADLTNFHASIKLLAQMVSQLLSLPPDYLAFGGQNPPSADAIRASERQQVKKAERMQQSLGTRWERVQRLVLLTQGKPDTDAAKQIETLWRDASTPTIAQQADATVKLVGAKDSSGRSIVPVQQAREDLGYTKTQQKRMADWDAQGSAAAVAAAVQAASEAAQVDGQPA